MWLNSRWRRSAALFASLVFLLTAVLPVQAGPDLLLETQAIASRAAASSMPIHNVSAAAAQADGGFHPLRDVAAVVVGQNHTCALTTAGGVKCWGENNYGQLGDGTTTDRLTPVDVSGLTSGVQAIAAGNVHTCALTTGGGVKCWGSNYSGQLGDGLGGSDRISLLPVSASGLTSGVQAIAAGGGSTCALTNGGAKCWGNNWAGQLGDGTSTNRLTPVNVVGLTSGVQALTAGDGHTCALTTGGGAKCWGDNTQGQTGSGALVFYQRTPVDVSGLTSGVQMVAGGGSHTCAVVTGGGVKCWGSNQNGQLGDGTVNASMTPVAVSGLTTGVTSIAAGYQHTCALNANGGVQCWGYNSSGQLGLGIPTNHRLIPTDVAGLTSGAQAVAAGSAHTCALTSSGGVKCWGSNSNGQLGIGQPARFLTPIDVAGLNSSAQKIDAGSAFTCVLTTGGGVQCWGGNGSGQLGDGTTAVRSVAADVSGLSSGVQSISVGILHTCAVTTGGGAKCWGGNQKGQLGDGADVMRVTPVDVSGLTSGVQAVSAGYLHTCALTTSGGVKCWGDNSFGQVGNGEPDIFGAPIWTPVDVVGLTSGVRAIAAGRYHTCALTTGGGVKCWGYNLDGQLGDGTDSIRLTPVNVRDLASGVQAIAAGAAHTCALTTTGGVKCWGSNSDGQLGSATFNNFSLVPLDVTGLARGVQAISTRMMHNCALTGAGGVKCWGSNGSGQIGDGTWDNDARTPVDVVGLASGVQAIGAGYDHTCALTTSGSAKCWGGAGYHQVGLEPPWTPVDVVIPDTPMVDNAIVESQITAPTVSAGAPLRLWFNVRNSGTTTWDAGQGYGWRGLGQWQGQMGAVDRVVAPNDVWLFTTDVVAPAAPGVYWYGIVLQHNGVDFGPNLVTEITVVAPAATPALEPTFTPTVAPTVAPTVQPTLEPTATPTVEPAFTPTNPPTVTPTVQPTLEPTATPTVEPAFTPTVQPTVTPTAQPTLAPTATPTMEPAFTPTVVPTVVPTAQPTLAPPATPTVEPTFTPTVAPTVVPTVQPTLEPTATPTVEPAFTPTDQPTVVPTVVPTVQPALEPTATLTVEPAFTPTDQPAAEPILEATPTPFPEPIENGGLAPNRTEHTLYLPVIQR